MSAVGQAQRPVRLSSLSTPPAVLQSFVGLQSKQVSASLQLAATSSSMVLR
jgi:hypothetical protein